MTNTKQSSTSPVADPANTAIFVLYAVVKGPAHRGPGRGHRRVEGVYATRADATLSGQRLVEAANYVSHTDVVETRLRSTPLDAVTLFWGYANKDNSLSVESSPVFDSEAREVQANNAEHGEAWIYPIGTIPKVDQSTYIQGVSEDGVRRYAANIVAGL